MRSSSEDKKEIAAECVLAKITQYECTKGKNIVCKPIERLFKRCPGLPSVELISAGDRFIDIRTHEDIAEWRGAHGRSKAK
ncbi:hypothetical protein H4R20_001356 [Coemansia guatemalensis]|uniref:Uncharacterized protein n=1 Tax=Coemansia guatemalensis TaxID=2761395 RepID=A0A9W8HXK2_9FUNG|nr:hypothetical protein H4R20_001356 [Coemansia guatemalensis]